MLPTLTRLKDGIDRVILAGGGLTDAGSITLRLTSGRCSHQQVVRFHGPKPMWTTVTHSSWVGDSMTLGVCITSVCEEWMRERCRWRGGNWRTRYLGSKAMARFSWLIKAARQSMDVSFPTNELIWKNYVLLNSFFACFFMFLPACTHLQFQEFNKSQVDKGIDYLSFRQASRWIKETFSTFYAQKCKYTLYIFGLLGPNTKQ